MNEWMVLVVKILPTQGKQLYVISVIKIFSHQIYMDLQ